MRAVAAWACACAVLASVACTRVSTSGAAGGPNQWTVQGVLRMAIKAEPNTLNPVLSGLIEEGEVEGAIFDGLVKFDDHGNLQPDLAVAVPSQENGGISRDGRTITYHLRHGVTWQDGAPFSAADVAFTYRAYTDPTVNTFYTETYKRITKLETPDPFTVVIHMKEPFAPALLQFFELNTGGFVIPEHLLSRSADFNSDPFGKHPVGTGPFTLERWDHGSLIVLRANPHYFGGMPKVREVDVHIVPNPNTQITMLSSHELDVAAYLTPVQLAQVRQIAGVHALLVPTLLERFLTFNGKRAPFDDPVVRRALAMALDRERLNRTAYVGTAVTAQTLIPPSSWAYDPAGAPGYGPKIAASLLQRDGWVLAADGTRHKGGRQLSFGLLNQTESNALSTMGQEIQREWLAIGVTTQLRAVPKNVIYGNPGLATDGKFDSLLDDWEADPDPDRSQIIETKSFAPHSYNDAFYSDADVDRWSEQALATYDAPARKRLYSLIQRRLNRDLPYVPLVWEGRIFGVNDDLHGFAPAPGSTEFWNATSWRI